MENIPKISEAEWVVMKTIWNENPITANRIVETLSETTSWNPKTIKTLLNRLVKKGAVGFKNKGRTYDYFPLIAEDIVIKEESRSFLKRVFGGALKPMLTTLIESEDLTQEDIEDLKNILQK